MTKPTLPDESGILEAERRGVAVGAHAARARGEGDVGGGLRTTGGDSRDLSGARDTGRELESELQCLAPLVEEKRLTRDSVKELVETYTRQAADFEAYKARAEDDLASAAEAATTSVLDALFKVLDTFELAEAGLKPGNLAIAATCSAMPARATARDEPAVQADSAPAPSLSTFVLSVPRFCARLFPVRKIVMVSGKKNTVCVLTMW